MTDEAKIQRIFSYQELRQFGITWGRAQLRELCRTGQFPRQVELSRGRIGWLEADLQRWQASRPTASAYRPEDHPRDGAGTGSGQQGHDGAGGNAATQVPPPPARPNGAPKPAVRRKLR